MRNYFDGNVFYVYAVQNGDYEIIADGVMAMDIYRNIVAETFCSNEEYENDVYLAVTESLMKLTLDTDLSEATFKLVDASGMNEMLIVHSPNAFPIVGVRSEIVEFIEKIENATEPSEYEHILVENATQIEELFILFYAEVFGYDIDEESIGIYSKFTFEKY